MPSHQPTKSNTYQVFMLALCLYALLALAVERVWALPPGSGVILAYADVLVCGVFFVDFVASLWRAENRARYFFTWGWLDFLSSVPMVDALRIGRIGRILRVFRVLRGVRATKLLAGFVLDRRSSSMALAAALVSLLLVVSSAIGILHFESTSDANIKGPEDALWWALTTITTVGYGDRYPITTEGRLLASVLMLGGVGLFGTLSGFVAAWFLAPEASRERSELEALRDEVAALRRAIEAGPRASLPTNGSGG
jgi:voltage-gated potassium channel